MNDKYQEKAIRLSSSQAGPKVCSTCGAPCAHCTQMDESNSPDERFNETEERTTSELKEKKAVGLKKGGRFEEI
jgi:hypothetical protein